MKERIRAIVTQHGRLTGNVTRLADTTDLYDAGMTSHGSVELMIELEAAFEIEFPEHLITRHVFQSVATLEAAISSLLEERRLPFVAHADAS